MTASKTPNLSLMNPVGSDAFTTADFASTFQTLDTVPGVLVVANQASRPTGWGGNQHGRMVWQADLNVMWTWNQPVSATPGVWLRHASAGYLAGNRNASQVGTSAITVGTAPTVVSTTAMIPGGRSTLIMYDWTFIGGDPIKYATLNLMANSTMICESRHNGNTFGSAYTTNFPYPPQSSTFFFIRPSSGSQESVTFALKLRCQDPAEVGSSQGGGSVFVINLGITVVEL